MIGAKFYITSPTHQTLIVITLAKVYELFLGIYSPIAFFISSPLVFSGIVLNKVRFSIFRFMRPIAFFVLLNPMSLIFTSGLSVFSVPCRRALNGLLFMGRTISAIHLALSFNVGESPYSVLGKSFDFMFLIITRVVRLFSFWVRSLIGKRCRIFTYPAPTIKTIFYDLIRRKVYYVPIF